MSHTSCRSISIEAYEEMNTVVIEALDALGCDDRLTSRGHLQLLTSSNLDCEFAFFVARDNTTRDPLAISYGFLTKVSVWRNFSLCVFVSGSPVNTGLPFEFDSNLSEKEEVLGLLVSKMCKFAKRKKASVILIRDFFEDVLPWFERLPVLNRLSLRPVPIFQNAFLDIRWASYDEYLQMMRGRYRKQIRYDLKKILGDSDYTVRFFNGVEALNMVQDIHRLWVQTFRRHPDDLDQLYLTYIFFHNILKENRHGVMCIFKGQSLASFGLLLNRGETIESSFCGQDYGLTGNDPVDRVLTHLIVQHAIEKHYKTLDLGISNEAIKARVGCRFELLNAFVGMSNSFLSRIIPIDKFIKRMYHVKLDDPLMPKNSVFMSES